MRSFEEISEKKVPESFEKLTQLSGGLEKNKKQFLKVRQQVEDIRGKYNRNKSDFVLNGKMRNAASFISLGEGYCRLTAGASSAVLHLFCSLVSSNLPSKTRRPTKSSLSCTKTPEKPRAWPAATTS